jgi:hypothetical protein
MLPMQGRHKGDLGIPLWEAVERWTPRELWQRYRELASHDIPLIILGREEPEQVEAMKLRSRIEDILIAMLTRGELIASGIALPLKETSRRRDIRPELWPCLGFNFGFSGVAGSGLQYDQILIREASSAGHDVPATSRRSPSPEQSSHRAASRRGRPSVMSEIKGEMRRRAASGQLAPSMRQEAKDLFSWARHNLHEDVVPKAKSIENALSQTYRELRAKNRTDK